MSAFGPPLQTVFPVLFLQLPQLRSAGQRNSSLWFLQHAHKQDITLRSHPLSGSMWVGVCEYAGRCAPQSWKCSKISLQLYCHLHNWAFFSFSYSLISSCSLKMMFFFLVFLLSQSPPQFSHSDSTFSSSISAYLLTRGLSNACCEGFILHCHSSMQQMPRQQELTVTLWFWEIALAHIGKESTAMEKLPHSVLLKSTTSFDNVANTR